MSSAGRSAAQPVASLPPGLNAVAGLRGAPPRRKRSITRPRDHVTVWPLFHAIISLSICPNDARPIRPPPLPPPPIPRSQPYAYICMCVAYLHNAPIVFHTRVLYTPIMHVDACVLAYLRTHTCMHAARSHTRPRSPSLESNLMLENEDHSTLRRKPAREIAM